jgi:hypothetical protein
MQSTITEAECERRCCLGKRQHPNRRKAKEHAQHLRSLTKLNYNFYRCEYCGWFHVGHTGNRK